jgi:hypothetical protein
MITTMVKRAFLPVGEGDGNCGRLGVAVDGSGNVLVADALNHTIRKVTSSGVVTTLAGLVAEHGSKDGTGSSARFHHPSGVAVDGFPLPAASKDAAVLGTFAVGEYTARVTGRLAGGSGISLTEIYDRDHADAAGRLGNISTLGFVGGDAQTLAFGFVIDGVAPKTLLIRGVGPGLTSFGVAGMLGDPQLSVTPLGKNIAIAGNDNWNGDAALGCVFVSAGTFALPVGSKDAAVVVRLPPGGYTVMGSAFPIPRTAAPSSKSTTSIREVR